MRLKILLSTLLFFLVTMVHAQDTLAPKYWTFDGKTSLHITQNYFANWAAGGQTNLAGVAKLTLAADYKKDKISWSNWLDLAYGSNFYQDLLPLKTDDKIEFITTLGYDASDKWIYTLQGSFRTQFADGFQYDIDSTEYISRFMAPAFITIGPGMDFKSGVFSINISPATARWVIVNDEQLADEGAFGVDPAEYDENGNKIKDGKRSKFAFGARIMAVYQQEVAKNVNLGSKLELFSDYLDNPQNVKVDWQVVLNLKVNDWLSTEISTHLIYDDEIMIADSDGNKGPRTQFKQTLSVGLTYNFGNK